MLKTSILLTGFLIDYKRSALQPSFDQVGMVDRNDYRLFQILMQGESISIALKSSREILDLY